MANTENRPSLAALTGVFLKIANLTFGGGDPTMAALQREFTGQRKWLDMERHTLAYSLARITPGTNVLAYCAASAWLIGGLPAAVAAVIAASLPASLIALWLVIGYQASTSNRFAQAAVASMIAAVVGMMLAAAWALVKPHCTRRNWPRIVLYAGGTLLLREWLAIGPVQLVGICALAGVLWVEGE
ncbi:MAG: chromate transporter [Bryobacteraceae bacterium]|nr:chromate transporter [Bryobacteraceae bacterium]